MEEVSKHYPQRPGTRPLSKKILNTAHTCSIVSAREHLGRRMVVVHQRLSTASGTRHDIDTVSTSSDGERPHHRAPARQHWQHTRQAGHHHGEALTFRQARLTSP